MSEESLETRELHESLEETREHVEHAHHEHAAAHGDAHAKAHHDHHAHKPAALKWTVYLSLSTALVAVLAAVSSLQSGANESSALLEKNSAIMAQGEYNDNWAHYQAKSTKSAIFEAQLDVTDKPEVIEKFKKRIEGYNDDKHDLEEKAEKLKEEQKQHEEKSEEFLHHHHRFALAVTIFQVGIALSAIAALTKRKPLWFASMAVAVGGAVFLLKGFGLLGG